MLTELTPTSGLLSADRTNKESHTFKHDFARVMVSVGLRPHNWRKHTIANKTFSLENNSERMRIWVANSAWGLDFSVDGRSYGGVTMYSVIPFVSWIVPWRRKLYNLATRMAKTSYIKEWSIR